MVARCWAAHVPSAPAAAWRMLLACDGRHHSGLYPPLAPLLHLHASARETALRTGFPAPTSPSWIQEAIAITRARCAALSTPLLLLQPIPQSNRRHLAVACTLCAAACQQLGFTMKKHEHECVARICEGHVGRGSS